MLVSVGREVNIKYISDNAFRNCTELTSVTIDDNIPEIGKYAFLESLLPLLAFLIFYFTKCPSIEQTWARLHIQPILIFADSLLRDVHAGEIHCL